MDEAFFEKLYRGYAAEHLVASQLYRHGFEVFRLPADFGLDLVVTNQFMVARKQTAAAPQFPFDLQVKSRWLKPQDTVPGPSGRPETTVFFQFRSDELDLMLSHGNAGAALVAYCPIGGNLRYEPFYLWLHASQLESARDAKCLIPDGTGWKLGIRYRRMPRQTREQFVKEIEAESPLPFAAKRKLLRELPPSFERNWKTTDYLAFARKARDGTDSTVFRAVWNVSMDFDSFPNWQPIGGFD